MTYTNCKLYKLQSKKGLNYLLGLTDKAYYRQVFLCANYNVYITKEKKPRLIEAPANDIKKIQSRIKNLLSDIDIPYYVFSGVKGKSYVDNAKLHQGNKYVFKVDISGFFPCIRRDKVYVFFKNELKTSSDVAEILTNLTTIDLSLCEIGDATSVEKFILEKGITTRNHLVSGAPTSQLLSYFANKEMFDELRKMAEKASMEMTVYVDDVVFSSDKPIKYDFREKVIKVIKKNGYQISTSKVKLYTKDYSKLITGVVIDKNGNLTIRNAMRENILNEIADLKNNPLRTTERLTGLLIAARQAVPGAYEGLYNCYKD